MIERIQPRAPIYMRVPPGHAKHWDKHFREYNVCGEQVYFVQDNWYSSEYVPRYQEKHSKGKNKNPGGKHSSSDSN